LDVGFWRTTETAKPVKLPVHKINVWNEKKRWSLHKIQIAGGVSPKIFCSAASAKKLGETGDLPQVSEAKVF